MSNTLSLTVEFGRDSFFDRTPSLDEYFVFNRNLEKTPNSGIKLAKGYPSIEEQLNAIYSKYQ